MKNNSICRLCRLSGRLSIAAAGIAATRQRTSGSKIITIITRRDQKLEYHSRIRNLRGRIGAAREGGTDGNGNDNSGTENDRFPARAQPMIRTVCAPLYAFGALSGSDAHGMNNNAFCVLVIPSDAPQRRATGAATRQRQKNSYAKQTAWFSIFSVENRDIQRESAPA